MAKGEPVGSFGEEKEALAGAFVKMLAPRHDEVDEAFFKRLREKWSDAEIAELCAYVSFTTASQMFGAVLGLKAEDSTTELTNGVNTK